MLAGCCCGAALKASLRSVDKAERISLTSVGLMVVVVVAELVVVGLILWMFVPIQLLVLIV